MQVRRIALTLLALLSFACATKPAAPSSNSTQFAFCPPANFANCTVAKCDRKADGNYTCWCFEDDRFSATAWMGSQSASCIQKSDPKKLQSRYHPTAAYQECGNGAPVQQWAWCLGIMCERSDNPNDAKANVRCDCIAIPANVPPLPYVVTTSAYSPENCNFKYWSSATPSDVSQITTFLQSQPGLSNLAAPTKLTPPK